MPRSHRRPPILLGLRVLVWRARHALVAVVVLLGLAAGVRQVAPPPDPTEHVVVAARDIPAGAVLTERDLHVVRVPVHLVPDGTTPRSTSLVGRGVSVRLTRGLPVVESVLTGARFALDPPAGSVVVPVMLPPATTAGLLRPGDLVDLVAAPAPGYSEVPVGSGGEAAGPQVLAKGAVVVDVGGQEDAAQDGAGALGLDGPEADEAPTLVAVTPQEGRLLAAATGRGPLGAVLVGGSAG